MTLDAAIADELTLRARLDGQTRVLEIDGDQHFDYESVYFDTPDAASFLLAAHPRRRHFTPALQAQSAVSAHAA